MDLVSTIPSRFGRNALSDFNPEIVVGFRAMKGATFFVNSANASSGGNGASWDSAYTTLGAANAAATAGDIVCVAAGHAETCIAAGTITISKSNVQIICMGQGRNRATISYTTSTAASFDITGNNVAIFGMVFRPLGIDAITAAVNITGTDCSLLDCDFELANSTNQATLGVLSTAAADRITISGCRFYGSANAGTATCLRIVGGDAHLIENNTMQGNYTTTLGGIQNVTTAWTNCIIRGNAINNRTASAAVCITAVTGATGHIYNNRMQVLTGTAPIVADAMSWVGGNYYAATIAALGVLI